MKSGYTHITVLIDKSGSMSPLQADTIGGFNSYLAEQQALPGTATLSLVLFDTGDPFEVVHGFKPIAAVEPLTYKTYRPAGGTPLLDAIGNGINDLGKQLAALPESHRPEKVVFAIITDGQENSSKEFTKAQIEAMIKTQREAYNWQIVFQSSDLSAMQDAQSYGISPMAMASYAPSGAGVRSAFNNLSEGTRSYRESAAPDASLTFEEAKP